MRLSPEMTAKVLELAGESHAKPRAPRPVSAVATGQPMPPVEGQRDPITYLDDVPSNSVVARVVHEGEPLGKHRPRFSRRTGKVYTPGSTKKHQASLAAACAAFGPFSADREFAYGIRAVFYVQTHQRKDVDNMLKTVLDAVNRLVFADDSQVKEVMGWSILDCFRPRTEFVVYRLHKIDREQGACIQCGKLFRRYQSWRARLYCSRKCNTIATTSSVEVSCANCGKTLLRQPSQIAASKSNEFFCSGSCISTHKAMRVRCAACGAVLCRPQSLAKTGQTNFYCDKACHGVGRFGRKRTDTPEQRREATLRAWETRRAKKAAENPR